MIEAKLEQTRRQLLDLTRKNRLLNHKVSGQQTLQIWDEIPNEVYRSLVEKEHVMQFLSRDEAPDETRSLLPTEDSSGDNTKPSTPTTPADPEQSHNEGLRELPLARIATSTKTAERHVDKNLQTALAGSKLQSRLLHLARESASALEEQGYNILYLTLGMVQWRDHADQDRNSNAPVLFIPVSLQRKNVQTRYNVRLLDDELRVNPCLIELCDRDFGFSFPTFDPDGDVDLGQYFSTVEDQIKHLAGWRFTPEIHLGLFSFSKLLMYHDLDPKSWPKERKLTDHPVIRRLSGIIEDDAGDSADQIPDPTTLDETISAKDCFQVVDADSSQQAAILAAKQGLSMVIDGPPGTGKSQTITNIIAECLSDGRTVLFVAEKAAALDVVKRNLEKSGLGDFVLELHSRKASKKAVLQELQRVLDKTDPPLRVAESDAHELDMVRRRLNEYRSQLHGQLGNMELSPFQAISQAVKLATAPEAPCQIPDVIHWSRAQLLEAQETLKKFDQRLGRVGDPAVHVWRGVGCISPGLATRQLIASRCKELAGTIRTALDAGITLADVLGVKPPASMIEMERLMADGGQLLESPAQLSNLVPAEEFWDKINPDLETWLKFGTERERARSIWAQHVKPEAERMNWEVVRRRRSAVGRSLFRVFRPSWYRDGRQLKASLIVNKLPPIDLQIAILENLVTSGRLRGEIEARSAEFASLFGACWRGVDSDWKLLRQYVKCAASIRALVKGGAINELAARRALKSGDRADLAHAMMHMTRSPADLRGAWAKWLEAIQSNEQTWLGSDFQQANLRALSERLLQLPLLIEQLGEWADFQVVVKQCRSGSLSSFANWALGPDGANAKGTLSSAFTRQFYCLWVDAAFAALPALHSFRGEDHEILIQRFRDLDKRWLEVSKARLSALIEKRRRDVMRTPSGDSNLALVQAEARKKTRHMPIRKLFSAAGKGIQVVKPCFMMSPNSVAQFLAPGEIEFDVVIFDEASQVHPADAYGAIARGRQLILAGDENQLPPTDFFSKTDAVGQIDAVEGAEVNVHDLESILSGGIVRLQHRCGLRWHYRSKHASLIQFSNAKFYDSRLRVFPSPHTDCSEMGLSFRYVESGVYGRGSSRDNPVEARIVAKAVIQHAFDHPELTLGVGTLNAPQQTAIEDEIERLRIESSSPALDKFFDRDIKEPFFVKNLETIQGDERDVIFLSIGYGKDASGRMRATISNLNNEGGWRRLNVLITRARQRCRVFSSIRSDDIELTANSRRGVVALKEYLQTAETGKVWDAERPAGGHDSEFEEDVCSAIGNHGWTVHSQIGCVGFSIDLAVVDPAHPGRYLLGIECDGATYHGSATARDRDRLRQAVLESLGWKIHRIWSTDWFHRPKLVLEKLLCRLDEEAKRETSLVSVTPSPGPGSDPPASLP